RNPTANGEELIKLKQAAMKAKHAFTGYLELEEWMDKDPLIKNQRKMDIQTVPIGALVWPSSHFRKDQQAHSTTLKTWVSRVGDVMAAQPKFLARFKASSEAIYETYGGAGVLNSESLYVKECKY
ncbi:hypothetical protein Tco_0981827, partial [Tanacetum coccineum]